LLHPQIADDVWIDLVRGDLETAVFKAFKAVEIAVREAGNYDPTDIGTALMRKAFDKLQGPLANPEQPEGERDSLAHLFAGAIGSYKNPHSHRTVTISDPNEAQKWWLLQVTCFGSLIAVKSRPAQHNGANTYLPYSHSASSD
jgi:uncharacterized protein (TIGR02391 family)